MSEGEIFGSGKKMVFIEGADILNIVRKREGEIQGIVPFCETSRGFSFFFLVELFWVFLLGWDIWAFVDGLIMA